MQRSVISGVTAIALLLLPSLVAEAQSNTCPVVNDTVVSTALGQPVQGKTQPIIPGFDLCSFTDASGTNFGVSRESNAFGPGEGGAVGLAQRYIPQLSDDMRAQIAALGSAGINIAAPGYDITAISDVGDAALLVKTELVPGFFKDSLIVQHGSDGFAFDTDDSPSAPMKLNALAQGVLANLTQ